MNMDLIQRSDIKQEPVSPTGFDSGFCSPVVSKTEQFRFSEYSVYTYQPADSRETLSKAKAKADITSSGSNSNSFKSNVETPFSGNSEISNSSSVYSHPIKQETSDSLSDGDIVDPRYKDQKQFQDQSDAYNVPKKQTYCNKQVTPYMLIHPTSQGSSHKKSNIADFRKTSEHFRKSSAQLEHCRIIPKSDVYSKHDAKEIGRVNMVNQCTIRKGNDIMTAKQNYSEIKATDESLRSNYVGRYSINTVCPESAIKNKSSIYMADSDCKQQCSSTEDVHCHDGINYRNESLGQSKEKWYIYTPRKELTLNFNCTKALENAIGNTNKERNVLKSDGLKASCSRKNVTISYGKVKNACSKLNEEGKKQYGFFRMVKHMSAKFVDKEPGRNIGPNVNSEIPNRYRPDDEICDIPNTDQQQKGAAEKFSSNRQLRIYEKPNIEKCTDISNKSDNICKMSNLNRRDFETSKRKNNITLEDGKSGVANNDGMQENSEAVIRKAKEVAKREDFAVISGEKNTIRTIEQREDINFPSHLNDTQQLQKSIDLSTCRDVLMKSGNCQYLGEQTSEYPNTETQNISEQRKRPLQFNDIKLDPSKKKPCICLVDIANTNKTLGSKPKLSKFSKEGEKKCIEKHSAHSSALVQNSVFQRMRKKRPFSNRIKDHICKKYKISAPNEKFVLDELSGISIQQDTCEDGDENVLSFKVNEISKQASDHKISDFVLDSNYDSNSENRSSHSNQKLQAADLPTESMDKQEIEYLTLTESRISRPECHQEASLNTSDDSNVDVLEDTVESLEPVKEITTVGDSNNISTQENTDKVSRKVSFSQEKTGFCPTKAMNDLSLFIENFISNDHPSTFTENSHGTENSVILTSNVNVLPKMQTSNFKDSSNLLNLSTECLCDSSDFLVPVEQVYTNNFGEFTYHSNIGILLIQSQEVIAFFHDNEWFVLLQEVLELVIPEHVKRAATYVTNELSVFKMCRSLTESQKTYLKQRTSFRCHSPLIPITSLYHVLKYIDEYVQSSLGKSKYYKCTAAFSNRNIYKKALGRHLVCLRCRGSVYRKGSIQIYTDLDAQITNDQTCRTSAEPDTLSCSQACNK